MGDNTFLAGQQHWLERLGNLRNVVRQELVARQLSAHLSARPLTVLDVGAGQGTQALRLARAGHVVTAVEPDPRMRAVFTEDAAALDEEDRARVSLVDADLAGLSDATRGTAYDVVLCHGVLMYLPESRAAVAALAARLAPGGLLSIVTRNGDAMAWRPAVRHDWPAAQAMLDEQRRAAQEGRDALYRNEIGVDARADSLASLHRNLEAAGLHVDAWYGIRVASDDVPLDAATPGPEELSVLLEVEERLGSTDPYRALGTLVHVLARAPRRTP
ncbi:methyltransferase domain-containing protein [Terrabacter sp. NPDC080008]|uniref:methyltransferase domain-containing protein n=1 Tax=Terrabacter sp. NPDC080008 TaxID=3155176 RepID=UPI00344DFD79